jgi:hypothetical protein
MQKLIVGLVVGLLWFWPLVIGAGESGRTGEQNPEQRQLLTKDQIQQLQERLKAEGVDPGPVDGVMNPRTEAALRNIRRNSGYPSLARPMRQPSDACKSSLPLVAGEAGSPGKALCAFSLRF